jgi:hypothetical protein
MELNRLARVVRERWRIVVLIAIIGFASAFGFTALANRGLSASYEALVALRFDPGEGETLEDLASEINNSAGLAVLAAEDLLAEYGPTSSIFADTGSGKLFFKAEGDTRELALNRVNSLLQKYLETDPTAGGDLTAQLAALEEEAIEVAAEIEGMAKVITPAEQALVSQHDVLDLSITAVRDQIVALSVADAGASATQRQENATQRDNLLERLNELLDEKAALPGRPSTELTVVEQLRYDALVRRFDLIGVDYERIALRTMGVVGEGTQLEAPEFHDLTPNPASSVSNGIIGLIGGSGLAMFALVFVTRSRKEIWLPEDLPIPVLGEIPLRRVTNLPGPAWYDSTIGGPRKESIQATRTAIEGWLDHGSAAFAITGDRVGPVTCHALAVDLAAAFASAGRSVLLIDADFGESVDITEYQLGEPSLGSVLRLPAGLPEVLDERVSGYISDAVQIRRDLAVIPPGQPPDSPADALAGPQFRRLVHQARERFDLVVGVGGEADSAAAQVLMQRLGAAIIAVAPGKSTIPRVNSLLVDLSQQRVELPGVMMMGTMESRVALRSISATRPVQKTSPDVSEQEAFSRLRFYPFPGSKRSISPSDGSLGHLAEGLVDGRRGVVEENPDGLESDSIGIEIVSALESSDVSKALEPVAEYVVARVEDLMTAVPGQANVSDDLVDAVREYAFIPISPVKGIPSVGERLVSELQTEVGVKLGHRLAAEMAKVLTGEDLDPATSINAWLSREFFKRHLHRTDREPEVWHLRSKEGTVQVLVNGRRLTDERLGRMTTDVVRRNIDEMERTLKGALAGGDEAVAESMEHRLKDAHLFEVAIGLLRGGDNEDARLVYPWRRNDPRPRGWKPIWTEGIRPNIAPLQRLDILAEPVLTEDELSELLLTG